MKPFTPNTSPFAYQTTGSLRSNRAGETPRTNTSRERRDPSQQRSKKHSRSSEEGRSASRRSQSQSSSASSIFSQQNVTLEELSAATPPSTPGSPKMSASRATSTSRPTKSSTRSTSQCLIRAVGQKEPSKQPTVEDDLDVTPTPTPVKTPVQNPIDRAKPNTTPPPAAVPATPAPAPKQQHTTPKPDLLPAKLKLGEDDKVSVSYPATIRKESRDEAKSQPTRSLDEAVSRQSIVPSHNPVVQVAPPAASPPHSPRLHAYNPYSYPPGYAAVPPPSDSQRSSPVSLPQGVPPLSYGYMPMMTGGIHNPMYGGPFYGMPFSPPAEIPPQNSERPSSPPATQNEHQQLLEKVAGVLPDINRLLHSYKETHGQLSTKEQLAKQADLSYNEQLTRIKVELDATKKEYEKVIQNLVGEKSNLERDLSEVRQRVVSLEKVEADCKALRAEVGALQANKKELMEAFDSIRRSKEELQTLKLAKEKEVESLKETLQAEKELYSRNITDVKEQAKDQMDAKQKDFHKTIGDHKLNYSRVQMELTSLLSKHNNTKKELEVARSSEADHRIKLDLKGKEFEDALARHGQEIRSIKKKHEEGQERLARESEERVAKIAAENSAKEKEWQLDLHEMGGELESEKAESRRLREELQTLRNSREVEKLQMSAELVESLALWRTKSKELQQQNQNLDRILQGLGCATEIKSKGDGFFLEAFHQLSQYIVNVSRDCFTKLPEVLPSEKMFLIPGEIPMFMDDSAAATELRACYIQHVISGVLLVRVFQPFLFTLGRRYGGVDTFLQSLSSDIRRKSERREAAWRQTTLRAAYTVSKAKQAINVVAAVIVDEIVGEIKLFAHRSCWPAITVGVQRIVKTAAEVWRFARVERELITTFMPEFGAFNNLESYWPEPEILDSHHEGAIRQMRDTSLPGQAILCVLPHIVREAVHEDFLGDTEKLANSSCVYLQGRALYADSEIIVARQSELGTSVHVEPHSDQSIQVLVGV